MARIAVHRFRALAPFLIAASVILAPPQYGSAGAQQSGARLEDDSNLMTLSAEVADVDVPGKGLIKGLYIYKLRGPGMASGAPAALMPPVIAATRGRTLMIDFFTNLPKETNLHTHGLSISPQGVGFGESGARPLYGDCILVNGEARNLPPSTSELAKVDPCKPQTEAPASVKEARPIRYRDVIPPNHPSGLFWFHPHVHGFAEPQVLAGLSGLLTIGDLWDYAYFECWAGDGAPPAGAAACGSLAAQQRRERALEQAADVHFIGLKDLQIDKDDKGDWALHDPNDYQKERCGAVTWDPAAPPELQRKAQLALAPDATRAPGGCWTDPQRQWIFTVSGEVYPTLTAPPGSVQIWRVANMSADVTYRLRVETKDKDAPLCPGSRADMSEAAQHRCLTLALLSRDGVPLDSGGANGQRTLELTLMPSARAEVYVPRCTGVHGAASAKDGCLATDRQIEAKLVTAGVAVGHNIDDADKWPPADLARVIAEPGDLSRLTAIAGRAPAKVAPSLQSAGYSLADLAPSLIESGGEQILREEAPAPQSGESVATSCDPEHKHYSVDARAFPKYGNVVRLVRFNNSDKFTDGKERFGLHVENFRLRDAIGKPIRIVELLDKKGGGQKLAQVNLEDKCHDQALRDASGKTFDFYYPPFPMPHDGQHDPIGAPLVHSWRSDRPEYWLLVNDSKECHNFHIHQTKFEVAASHVARDQTGESQDQCLGDRDPSKLASRTALHDNFPLPPGARILLRIAFGPDQLGRFVFHCHILEHEDKGMMSLLQVEERDSQGAPRAAATFPASDASTADAAAGHRKGRKASAAIPRRP